ncbi:formate acetyltransferase [Opitutaceae bacterium TAV4]|nr:formate acetyltransferase [Opitutaceae bacterium TAV4]RRK02118.1 formate acetyltransferase [Opitutaceae bacterium TAV3]
MTRPHTLAPRYQARLERLRNRKLDQTRAKNDRLGLRDEDDYGFVLPPDDFFWTPPVREPDGSFHGPEAWALNFRSLMENHPVYLDGDDALAGRWMFMLSRMRHNYQLALAPFPFDYSHLQHDLTRYDITCGIGKDAHFAPDYRIGLILGWRGLNDKVQTSLNTHAHDPEALSLLQAELHAIAGIRNWISRTADAAQTAALTATDPLHRANYEELATINRKLADAPPSTLREACQWIAWFNMATRTYNRDGAGGQLDILLLPYYERDIASGAIDDDDALFYLACLLLNDPHYYQLGGPDRNGTDQTSKLSFLILEAAHALKISCNLTIRVHERMDRKLFDRGMEILFADRLGYPRFSGDKALVDGFIKNGYSPELARERIALGCNWMSLPGREYTLNDLVKVNMAKVFEVALEEMFADARATLSTDSLMERFEQHLQRAVRCAADGIRFHLEHQHKNEPELLLNLLSHGPIEKGRDASHGGAEFYNMSIDGAGLAVVADSFAAIAQQIEQHQRCTWAELRDALAHDYQGGKRPVIQALLRHSDKYGQGNTLADHYAIEITALFTRHVKALERPGDPVKFIPGLFSWADTVRLGKNVGATPNGRHAGKPISHGANPNPGFRKDGALTAIVRAVAHVQPGYGNTAPLQLEIDPGPAADSDKNRVSVARLLEAHFDLGGTLVNINILNREQLLDAHQHPEKYPDLTVRVTGFSAYFASLSPDFRQLVVDRVLQAA